MDCDCVFVPGGCFLFVHVSLFCKIRYMDDLFMHLWE